MPKNSGKIFEEDLRRSVPEGVWCYRIPDSTNFYERGKNPCDFLLYDGHTLYALELKTTKTTTLSSQERIVKSHQRNTLTAWQKKTPNFQCGFLIHYRERHVRGRKVEPLTVYVPAALLHAHMKKHPSLRRADAEKLGIVIPQKKKRTRYQYDLSKLFTAEKETLIYLNQSINESGRTDSLKEETL